VNGDPNCFVSGLNPSVTLNEIQLVPELFPVIKAAIDRKRQAGRFLLTGSANVIACGFSTKGLPVGLTIAGSGFSEGRILSFAAAYRKLQVGICAVPGFPGIKPPAEALQHTHHPLGTLNMSRSEFASSDRAEVICLKTAESRSRAKRGS